MYCVIGMYLVFKEIASIMQCKQSSSFKIGETAFFKRDKNTLYQHILTSLNIQRPDYYLQNCAYK